MSTRLLLLAFPLLAAATAAAAPVTLRDGEAEVVIDPTSPDGIRDWRMSGVDHLKKEWLWIFGDGSEGSIDELPSTGTVTTDSDGDGDIDTLVARYQGLEGKFTLEIAWRLQDQGFQFANRRKSSLVTQLVVTATNTGEIDFDVDIYRYVDLDLGATPVDGPVAIEPDVETTNGHFLHNLMSQENEPGAPRVIYQGAVLPRPFPYGAPFPWPDGNSPEGSWTDVSAYPLALFALNGDPPPQLGIFGNDLTKSPGGADLTFTHAITTDFQPGGSFGWTFAEELTADIDIFEIVEVVDFFDELVGANLLTGVGGANNAPIRLSLYGLLLDAANGFDQADLQAPKCAALDAAMKRSDGQPKPGDWIQGQGLAAWQQALAAVIKAEGCSVPPPPPTDNPNG
jgi:hypothetical protein